MSKKIIREVPLQLGDAGRLFGILTLPDEQDGGRLESRVFVFLSAGLLHRIGPHRLYVRLARELAQSGHSSLRVDLAGIGDSSSRNGLPYQQSVAQDFEEILSVLESQLGNVSIVLAGLCSAADNAIRLALGNPRVVGMVLLDPVCEKDKGFRKRALGFRVREIVGKCTRLSSYTRWLKRLIRALTNQSNGSDEQVDYLSLRDIPPPEQLRAASISIKPIAWSSHLSINSQPTSQSVTSIGGNTGLAVTATRIGGSRALNGWRLAACHTLQSTHRQEHPLTRSIILRSRKREFQWRR